MRISFVNFTKTTVAINTKLTSNSFTHHIITFELCWRDGIPFSLCLTAVLVNQTNFGVVKQQHVMKYCQSRAIHRREGETPAWWLLSLSTGDSAAKKKTGGTPLLNMKKILFVQKTQILKMHFCIGACRRQSGQCDSILSLSLYSFKYYYLHFYSSARVKLLCTKQRFTLNQAPTSKLCSTLTNVSFSGQYCNQRRKIKQV